MEIIVFEKEAYYKMLEEVKRSVLEAIKEIQVDSKKITKTSKEDWVTTEEAQEILRCKYLKLRKIRDRKGSEIVYTVDGRKVLYSAASLHRHLSKNARN